MYMCIYTCTIARLITFLIIVISTLRTVIMNVPMIVNSQKNVLFSIIKALQTFSSLWYTTQLYACCVALSLHAVCMYVLVVVTGLRT